MSSVEYHSRRRFRRSQDRGTSTLTQGQLRRKGRREESGSCPMGGGDAGAELVECRGARQGAGGGRQRLLEGPGRPCADRARPTSQGACRERRPARAEATEGQTQEGRRGLAADGEIRRGKAPGKGGVPTMPIRDGRKQMAPASEYSRGLTSAVAGQLAELVVARLYCRSPVILVPSLLIPTR